MASASATGALSQQLPVILYHYPYSPYARRVLWYLQLRGIPFYQCLQPPILPRQDLLRLGITHRRIPLLSIGRDVYLDSRLIISKLGSLSSPQSLNSPAPSANPEHAILESLLRSAAIDNGIFAAAARLIPTNLPLTRDPKFQSDRADFFGTQGLSAQEAASLRPEALNDIKAHFHLLETTLFSDGRAWVLGTPLEEGPSLADIEAVWPLHWLTTLPGALPAEQVSADRFPNVFAWIGRFAGAVSAAKKKHAAVQSTVVDGAEAERIIRGAGLNEPAERWAVDSAEPIVEFHGLEKGRMVEVWPADTGAAHKDLGALVGLDADEIVIEKAGDGSGSGVPVRVHVPRHGFRLRGVKEGGSANL